MTADGALGLEAKTFIRHLADKIAVIWPKSNSEVLGYVRARMLFAVLRATNLCIRGSRVKWRRRMESWASIPARMSFSTASRASFVFIIFLVASVVVCVCFVCYSLACILYSLLHCCTIFVCVELVRKYQHTLLYTPISL